MSRFDDLLREYIDEISDNGFDSANVGQMMNALRQAANESFISDAELQKRMRIALELYFKRSLTKTRMNKVNPGVSRFTIDRLAPSLRTELERRILANADMIKLNREQAIDKTLQRFAGWASSVPKGGSRAINKSEVKADIGKTARQLKYEVRRREIDQGHKLMASIDAVVAQQGQAIAMQWNSHWMRKGYDFRPDHKERDGKIYAIRGSWAVDAGLINKGAGYTDEMTAVAEEINCTCFATYLFSLRDLPESMLTQKGRDELKRVSE